MIERTHEASPQLLARIGGTLYLTIIVSGLLGEVFIREPLIVAGNPIATMENIGSSATLWRIGIAANLFHLVCSLPLAVIFYILLTPVSRRLAQVAVVLNIAAIVLEAGSKLFLFPPLFLLGDAPYLQAFTADQLATAAYLSSRMHMYGFTISLVFFGFECLVLGYLIHRSTFLPRPLGWLMLLAGLCYVTNCFLTILAPAMASILIVMPSLLGELSLALCLLIRGVDAPRWKLAQQAI